jgi:methyl-accepting chemotaxis protein
MNTPPAKFADRLAIGAAERTQRLAFLRLGNEDIRLLRGMLPMMQRRVDGIVAKFYEHLLEFGDARAFFPDQQTLEHVKSTQREYLLDLCRGNFDDAYVDKRLQIGVVHERIGLVPKWYIGSYCNFLGLIVPMIVSRFWWRPGKCVRCIMAFIKIMNFDEQLAMDTYIGSVVAKLRGFGVQVREAAQMLAAAVGEISASSSQFAANATETSVSIVQTTTTMEEVRQTAELASEKARDVADGATKAAEQSDIGRKATAESADGIARIKQQMASIAESMVQLSDQSRAIGQIIASVDDLAQQSKLLAVNAAIEAAKAGEQGAGFAVVAEEVKTLAAQSKQATARIRAILGDIQKATSAAVMATEQGSHAVENGMAQSQHAGSAIDGLAASITIAADAATQIAASAKQQLTGVDQVADAMKGIKLASAQNVESARQLESATQRLQGLGQKLKLLTEQFQA